MHKHLLELVEILFGIVLIDNRNEEVQDEDEVERYEQKEEDEGRSVLIQRKLHDFRIVGGANKQEHVHDSIEKCVKERISIKDNRTILCAIT